MRILFLESFYGGSHREVADALVANSAHEIDLRTLPARFWKWRMRGAGLHFAHEIDDASSYDLVVCTGLMSVADFIAVARGHRPSPREIPPVLLYAHETQLAYPAPEAREADLHFAFTDLTNMLAADHVAFNSHTHREAYLQALPGFLRRLPEYRPMWTRDEVEHRSSVCYPGIRLGESVTELADGPSWPGQNPLPSHPEARINKLSDTIGAPLILWNHRWEFDKNPQAFFDALREVKARGGHFRLALLGENFQVVPKPFTAAREEFAEEIVHYGFVPDRASYEAWLARADIVVSTAIQENFGISVMEAVAHGAAPLLPRRLSYPEIIPEQYHESLYDSDSDLAARLLAMLTAGERPSAPDALVRHARSFAWERRVSDFDALFEHVSGTTHG